VYQEKYLEEHYRPNKSIVLQPVLFRRFYELKPVTKDQTRFFPLEIDNQTEYAFIQIIASRKNNRQVTDLEAFLRGDGRKFYVIEIPQMRTNKNGRREHVKIEISYL